MNSFLHLAEIIKLLTEVGLQKLVIPKNVKKSLRKKAVPVENPLEHSLAKKLSLIRWGDGESQILRKRSIIFQKYEVALREDLIEILKETRSKNPRILLGIPIHALDNTFGFGFRDNLHWLRTLQVMDPHLGDFETFESLHFRLMSKSEFREKLRNHFKNQFESKILFVGSRSNFSLFRAIFPDSEFVETAVRDSYSSLSALQDQIIKDFELDSFVLFVSMGPAGKVLLHRLSKLGFYGLDVGNFGNMPVSGSGNK